MTYKKFPSVDPYQAEEQPKAAQTKTAVVGSSSDYYGACSLEHFSSASGLSLTHEDAEGFLDYPTSFAGKATNFWFKDSGVKVWGYEETYDNWQDTYGMDAVRVFYHSGHGAMDGNGVFQAPLGGLWDNRDWAFSDRMAFGNEELRYLFWSTCFSLRVSGSDNPIRTWNAPNKGNLRMLFGYETTSVDDPSYGSKFWEEWRKGKSFKQAFLDASWRISHNQVASVMAVGANQADAINRLNTERFFTAAGVTKAWYQWEWIGTLPNRAAMATPPARGLSGKVPNALILAPLHYRDNHITQIAKRIGFTESAAGDIAMDDFGNKILTSKNSIIVANQEGSLNIFFKNPNYENRQQIELEKATEIAKKALDDYGIIKGLEMVPGTTRHHLSNGGTLEGSGTMDEPFVVSTIIQFRQAYQGIETVNSDHGLVTVKVDNDGKVTNIYSSAKDIVDEAPKPKFVVGMPKDKYASKGIVTEDEFSKKIQRLINSKTGEAAKEKPQAKVLFEKTGYDFSGNMSPVVHQKDVEIGTGSVSKRHKVRIPVGG